MASSLAEPDLQALATTTGIEIIDWPRDRRLREQLARAGVPRLLLIDSPETRPDRLAPDETVLPSTSSRGERAGALLALADAVRQFDTADPWVDARGVLHRGSAAVQLTAGEAAVTAALLQQPGSVVGREFLQQLLDADHPRSARSLEAVMYRLRRRLVDLHLVVRTVRGRGFAIDTGRAPTTSTDRWWVGAALATPPAPVLPG